MEVDDSEVDHYGRDEYLQQRADAIAAIGELATHLVSLPEDVFSLEPDSEMAKKLILKK